MLGSNQGVRKTSFTSDKQIMVPSAPHFAVGVVVDAAGGVKYKNTDLKVVKAGTPLYGNLDDRLTPFKTTGTGKIAGVLQHDCEVTNGNGNGDLAVLGVANISAMDEDVQAKYTEEVKAALPPTLLALKLYDF